MMVTFPVLFLLCLFAWMVNSKNSTPLYTLVIMWGRDKKVLMLLDLINCENKISLIKVFYCSPFSCYMCLSQAKLLVYISSLFILSEICPVI
jgi:hypothetical protein